MPPPPPPPSGPPPPPGPPPPGPPPSFGASGKGGPKDRSALLQSIQKGTKLKKTVTVDKSGPMISGRVANASSNSYGAPPLRSMPPSSMPPSNRDYGIENSVQMAPKLSGMFEGLSQMPKLKPVGSRTRGVTSNNDSTASPATFGNNAENVNRKNYNNDSPMDFNSERTRRLGKWQMAQQQPPNSNSASNSNVVNYQNFTPSQPQMRTLPRSPNMQNNSESAYVPKNKFNAQRNAPVAPITAKPSFTPKPFGAQNNGPSKFPNNNGTPKVSERFQQSVAMLKETFRPHVAVPRDSAPQQRSDPPPIVSQKPFAALPKPQFNERLQPTSPGVSPSTARRCPPVPPPPVSENQSPNAYLGTMGRHQNMGMNKQPISPPFPPQRGPPQVQPTRELPPASPNNFNYNRSPPPLPERNPSQNSYSQSQNYEYSPNVIAPMPIAAYPTKQFVIDIDAKFGHLFHDVRDFPAASCNQNNIHLMYN